MPRKRPTAASVVRDLGAVAAVELAESLTGREGRIALRLPAAKRDAFMAAAKRAGVPLSRWIERACDAALKR